MRKHFNIKKKIKIHISPLNPGFPEIRNKARPQRTAWAIKLHVSRVIQVSCNQNYNKFPRQKVVIDYHCLWFSHPQYSSYSSFYFSTTYRCSFISQGLHLPPQGLMGRIVTRSPPKAHPSLNCNSLSIFLEKAVNQAVICPDMQTMCWGRAETDEWWWVGVSGCENDNEDYGKYDSWSKTLRHLSSKIMFTVFIGNKLRKRKKKKSGKQW